MTTMQTSIKEAQKALDKVIRKSRVHLYKPIQIAEILYHDRTEGGIVLLNVEDYRINSKKWRDDMSLALHGRVCTRYARFQDDLFNTDAVPPSALCVLGETNREKHGIVEAYIYRKFNEKHVQLTSALDYCESTPAMKFNVKHFIDLFWKQPGLRRSVDKVYEMVVYALFATLIRALDMTVEISVNEDAYPILREFEDFSRMVMSLDFTHPSHIEKANVFRVGVTNAADRGLDMYSNWGPAIQIKHLTLDVEFAQNIVEGVSSDRIVIVCKDGEQAVISSLLTQIGWRSRIQSIVTEGNLVEWYDKALRGRYASCLGQLLIDTLRKEMKKEFPSISVFSQSLKDRHYELLKDLEWA